MESILTFECKIDEAYIDEQITLFRNDVLNNHVHIVHKHILSGIPFYFREDIDKYIELKKEISSFFKVNLSEIILVGSARLGFSIAPGKRFNKFNLASDIDVAVISNDIFNLFWNELFRWYDKYTSWNTKKQKDEFCNYLFQGWVRPDKMPNEFPLKKEWNKFFNELTSDRLFGVNSIKVGLYKSWDHLEAYHEQNVKNIRNEIWRG